MSRRMSGALGGALVTTLVLSGAVVLGQEAAPASPAAEEEPGPYQATLRSGTCDEPGDVAAVLADPMLGASTDSEEVSVEMGPAPDHAVRVSESEVPMPLADIAENGHALVIDQPEAGVVIACSDIGGRAIGDDRLPLVLSSPEGTTVGVALLSALGIDATQVLVLLAIPGERSEQPEGSPGPSPSPDAEGFAEPDPDEPGPDPDPDVDPGEDIGEDVSA
jgi:hypothetical protein